MHAQAWTDALENVAPLFELKTFDMHLFVVPCLDSRGHSVMQARTIPVKLPL